MIPLNDDILEYTDGNGFSARCRIRLEKRPGMTTVVATDISNYERCVSVTNSVELIASAVCEHFDIPRSELVLIEHYDDRSNRVARSGQKTERFAWVSFERGEDPTWRHITKEQVEKLLGHELP